ncbi:MAG: protein glxC [Gammaproteobacteria bacterium]
MSVVELKPGQSSAVRRNAESIVYDLAVGTVRELNCMLHGDLLAHGVKRVVVENPEGAHNICVGVDAPIQIDIQGHAGYFVAGQNVLAHVTVHGNVGRSLAENIMSGTVRVKGYASESVGASGHGGLVIVEGDAGSRCGISMKGVDIVVGGSVGHMSAFMAQAGRLVVCGDAGPGLGDSLYEAVIYVRGRIEGFGADAREEPMSEADYGAVAELLSRAGISHDPKEFKRVASARTLYHWNPDGNQEY